MRQSNYKKYIHLMEMSQHEALSDFIKTLTRDEKLALIDTLDLTGIPVMRCLAFNYETQEWVV